MTGVALRGDSSPVRRLRVPGRRRLPTPVAPRRSRRGFRCTRAGVGAMCFGIIAAVYIVIGFVLSFHYGSHRRGRPQPRRGRAIRAPEQGSAPRGHGVRVHAVDDTHAASARGRDGRLAHPPRPRSACHRRVGFVHGWFGAPGRRHAARPWCVTRLDVRCRAHLLRAPDDHPVRSERHERGAVPSVLHDRVPLPQCAGCDPTTSTTWPRSPSPSRVPISCATTHWRRVGSSRFSSERRRGGGRGPTGRTGCGPVPRTQWSWCCR